MTTSTASTISPSKRRSDRTPWLFVLPATLLLVALGIFPLLYSFAISFLQWDLQRPGQRLIWFKNYTTALQDNRLWEALGHTFFIILVAVTLELLLGLLLAQVLLDPLPGRRFIVPLLILPVVMAPLIVGYIWRMLWDTQFGPINQIATWLVGRPVEIVWLANPYTVYPALLVTEIWQWTPFMFLVLLAGLAAINPELSEAAAMDGASKLRIFLNITLPLIRPVMVLAILFRALDVFKLFDIIFSLTGGGPGSQTETISFYIYQLGFKNFRLGYTAAVAFLIILIVSVLVSFLWRRLGEEGSSE